MGLSVLYRAIIVFAATSACSVSWASATFVTETKPLPVGLWVDNSEDLCFVATETLKYLDKGAAYDGYAIHGGKVPGATIPLARVQQTLQFLCEIQQQDAAAGRPSRLASPEFVQRHFEFIRWYPDAAHAKKLSAKKPLLQNLPQDQILQTRYFVKIADAASTASKEKPFALYGLPFDEQGLSVEAAKAQAASLTRYRFGKQQILKGALDQPVAKAPALLYLNRTDLEGALLQGTAVIPSKTGYRYFNVHRGNEIPYDRTIKPEEQQRYWYFKEVKSVLGYGKDADYKIPIAPQVTVAGDIGQFGLGKVFLLSTKEHGKITYRLNILADTGGAFADNLYQLDWLSGYYRGWDDYQAANKHRDNYSTAWILIKK